MRGPANLGRSICGVGGEAEGVETDALQFMDVDWSGVVRECE